MIMKIGIVAGEIWHLLDNKGPTLLSVIIKDLDQPSDVILMSIGWLAREGHVRLETIGSDFTVSLNK